MHEELAEKIRRYVAEHSTIKQRDQIRDRNVGILEILLANSPEGVTEPVLSMIPIGCPHCGSCKACLWTAAYIEYQNEEEDGPEEICSIVPFNGYCLNQARVYSFCRVYYHSNDAHVEIHIPTKDTLDLAMESYIICTQFIQGHIGWTNTYEWGKIPLTE